jgi:hypothetical protein
MDLKIWLILLLFITIICLDYRHNQLERQKEQENFYQDLGPTPPIPLTKNCRLTENKQSYNYPQPSDKYQSVAQECISQKDFQNKNYYNLNDELVINARMTGYPRQPRPLM